MQAYAIGGENSCANFKWALNGNKHKLMPLVTSNKKWVAILQESTRKFKGNELGHKPPTPFVNH
jgi:putative IMPACT (imprinted ancient) family translation regulator